MDNPKPVSPGLYRLTLAVAAVACVFSLLVAILLVSTLMTVRVSSPLNLPELDAMRVMFKENPADLAIQTKIRDLDWMARRFYFGGLASRRTGIFLLLGGVAVSLISLRLVALLRRRRPNPREYPPLPDQRQVESSARWTLAGVMVAVLTATLYIGMSGRPPGAVVVVAVPATAVEAGVATGSTGRLEWTAFRGPSGSGVAVSSHTPDPGTGEGELGILWKAGVPLPGMSSPIVAGNKIYLTGASEEKREVYCYDLATGTRLWSVEAKGIARPPKAVPEIFKDTGSAAPTSVTDGLRVISIFANGDMIAVDHCAQILWEIDLGLPFNRYGHSASLAWSGSTVLIQYDQDVETGHPSRLIALDAVTGKTVWSTPRAVSDSWPSPVVVPTEKGPQLITVANEWIIAYDPGSGRELWKVHCAGTDVAPSAIIAGGLVLVSITADRIYAIRPDGTGDVSATHVAWTVEEGVSDVSSPVSNGELAFFVHSGGLLSCLEVKTGKKVWEQNLEGEFYGSPTLAADKLYLVARNGTLFILKAGREYGEIGKVVLGEPSDGSPVFAGDRFLVRGIKTLFCIGRQTK
jgi:outer membrane protein assembly factor BamB